MGSLGMPELLLIALVFIIVFGGGKLPQLGRGLGEGIRNFRDAVRDGERGVDKPQPEPPEAATAGSPQVPGTGGEKA